MSQDIITVVAPKPMDKGMTRSSTGPQRTGSDGSVQTSRVWYRAIPKVAVMPNNAPVIAPAAVPPSSRTITVMERKRPAPLAIVDQPYQRKFILPCSTPVITGWQMDINARQTVTQIAARFGIL